MSAETLVRLLVVEDERNVGSTLVERLESQGYQVVWSQTREDAELQLRGIKFDLALLDVGLPDGTGFEVAAVVREVSRSTAILFLTAYGTPEDRVKGLELGAEDYVVKPFHFKELLLRIQNALKRARYLATDSEPADGVMIGQARFSFSKFLVEVKGQPVSLTHKECALMRLLYERRGKVVSRDEILNEIWSAEEFPSPRTIDNFILKLRRWVEEDPENPKLIRSIRGVGYQVVLDGK